MRSRPLNPDLTDSPRWRCGAASVWLIVGGSFLGMGPVDWASGDPGSADAMLADAMRADVAPTSVSVSPKAVQPAPLPDRQVYLDRIRVAKQYYLRGRSDATAYDLAAERFAEAAAVAPDATARIEAIYYRAEALAAAERYSEAGAAFSASLDASPHPELDAARANNVRPPVRHPDAPRAQYRIAEMAFFAGRPDEASTAVTAFLTAYPTSSLTPHARLLSAKLDRAVGRIEAAQTSLRAVLTDSPGSPVVEECRLELARCAASVGRSDEAVRWWRMLADTPDHPLAIEATLDWGRHDVQQGEHAAAVSRLRPLLERDLPPSLLPLARRWLAEAELGAGNPTSALEHLDALNVVETAETIASGVSRSSAAIARPAPEADTVKPPEESPQAMPEATTFDTLAHLRLAALAAAEQTSEADAWAERCVTARPGTPLAEAAVRHLLTTAPSEQVRRTDLSRWLTGLAAGPYHDYVAAQLGRAELAAGEYEQAAARLTPLVEAIPVPDGPAVDAATPPRPATSRPGSPTADSSTPDSSTTAPSTSPTSIRNPSEPARTWTLLAAAALAELGRGKPQEAARLVGPWQAAILRERPRDLAEPARSAWRSVVTAGAEVALANQAWADAVALLTGLLDAEADGQAISPTDGPTSEPSRFRRVAQLAYALAQQGKVATAATRLEALPQAADAEPWTATALQAVLTRVTGTTATVQLDESVRNTLIHRAVRLADRTLTPPATAEAFRRIGLIEAVRTDDWPEVERLTAQLLETSATAQPSEQARWTQLRASALIALHRDAEAEILLTGSASRPAMTPLASETTDLVTPPGLDRAATDPTVGASPATEHIAPPAIATLPTESLRMLALVAERSGDRQAEIERLVALHDREPADHDVAVRLAWAFAQTGDLPRSDAVFTTLAEAGPVHPHWAAAAYRLAERAASSDRPIEARQWITRLLAVRDGLDGPEGSTAARRTGGLSSEIEAYTLFLDGQLAAQDRSWRHCRTRMMELIVDHTALPLRPAAHYWVAESDYQLGQFKEAGKRFEYVASLTEGADEPWRAMAPLRIGQLLAAAAKWSDALAVVAEIETTWPTFRQVHEVDFLRGRCLMQLSRFDEARAAWERVVRSPEGGPTETAAHAQWMIGESYFHQKRYPEAIRAFELVEMTWNDPKWQAIALLQAGKSHDAAGDRSRAARCYADLIRRFPDRPESREAADRLRTAGPSAAPSARR